MEPVDKVLYNLGYFNADKYKRQQVLDYMNEAEEFMINAGVKKDNLTSALSFTIKSLWCDSRDKGQAIDLVGKDKMILNIISQLKR